MAAKSACCALASISSGPTTLPLVRVDVWEEMMVDSSLLSSFKVPCLEERALEGAGLPSSLVVERGRRRYFEAGM